MFWAQADINEMIKKKRSFQRPTKYVEGKKCEPERVFFSRFHFNVVYTETRECERETKSQH